MKCLIKTYNFGRSEASVFTIVTVSTTIVACLFYFVSQFTRQWAVSSITDSVNSPSILGKVYTGVWVICHDWENGEGHKNTWNYCNNLARKDISVEYVAFQVLSSAVSIIVVTNTGISIAYLSCVKLNKSKHTILFSCLLNLIGVTLTAVSCFLFIDCLTSCQHNTNSQDINCIYRLIKITSNVHITTPRIDYSMVVFAVSGGLQMISLILMLLELCFLSSGLIVFNNDDDDRENHTMQYPRNNRILPQ